MVKMIGIGLVVIAVLISACHVRPTPDQISGANYGPYPDDYETIIKNHYSRSLFDPYSAVYTFSSPKKAWRSQFGTVKYGWVVCGTLNAKNRMGGYVGAKPFYIMIHYNNVIDRSEDIMADAACKQIN
jgi:hypothetical protein